MAARNGSNGIRSNYQHQRTSPQLYGEPRSGRESRKSHDEGTCTRNARQVQCVHPGLWVAQRGPLIRIGASAPPKDEEGQNREPLKQYLRREWQNGLRYICAPVETGCLSTLGSFPSSHLSEPPSGSTMPTRSTSRLSQRLRSGNANRLQDLPLDQGSEQEELHTLVRPLGPGQITSRPRVDSDALRRESTKIHRSRRRIDVTEGSTRTKADAMQMHQTSERNNFDEDRELQSRS